MNQEELNAFKILVRAYYDCLQERIDLDGMLGQKKDGTHKKNTPERDEDLLKPLFVYRAGRQALALGWTDEHGVKQKGLLEQISDIVHREILWQEFLVNVKGCGESIACVILSEFDIRYAEKKWGRCTTVSDLWSYAGLAPGKDRKITGQKCTYNQFLRSKLCGVLGPSFLKCQSQPYSAIYYEEKTRLENSDVMVHEYPRKKDKKARAEWPDPTKRMVKWRDAYPDHRHKAAIRKMVKEFLKHLYIAWREIEGLPIREPYSEEYLGKKHVMKKAAK